MTSRIAFVCSVVAGLAFGDVVSFTGTESFDLSNSANWEGGELPGEDDIAVVDYAGRDAEATFSTDLSFGGLVLTNLNGNVTLTGTNATEGVQKTLTLGAAGFVSYRVSAAQSNLTVNANLATTAAQFWTLPDDMVYFGGTITGTELLTVTNNRAVIHRVAPGYGGKIVYSYNKLSNHVVGLEKKGMWANDVECVGGRLEYRFTDTATWRELFPGRTVKQSATMLLTLPGEPKIDFVDGDCYTGTSGMLVVDKGALFQSGGAITSVVQVGYNQYASLYDMSGGTLNANQIVFGNQTSVAWYTNQMFRLRGGAVTAGSVFMGWQASGAAAAHSDILVEGGTFTAKDGTSQDSGIHFGYNKKDLGKTSRASAGLTGEFRMTGGTVKTPQIALGSHVDNDIRYCALLTNTYYTLRMEGGTLDVGALGFNQIKDRWNAREEGYTDTPVDSRYLLSLRTGTLAAYAPFTSELDLTFPSNDLPFTINTREHNVTLAAPISGKGAIDKTGGGALLIADGTRHTGALRIREGAVKLLGAASGNDMIAGERCVVWRADELAAGKESGSEVTRWPTVDGSRSADYDGISKNDVAVTKPTIALDAFNGHAGVAFNQSALKVSAQDNPIAGSTNWTICVVFKTDTKGLGNDGAWYLARGILGREEPGVQNDWGLVLSAYGHVGGGLGINSPSKDSCLYTSRDSADGQTHIIFYSMDCAGTRTVQVDDEVKHDTLPLDAAGKNPRKMSDIYLGVHNIADSGPKYYAFIGTIAEIRFYPDKALTPGEKAGLGATLAAKYGASGAIGGTGGGEMQTGELVQSAVDAPMPQDEAVAWDADDLDALTDGAAVETWLAADGTKKADLATGRIRYNSQTELTPTTLGDVTAPTLVKNAVNGHHVVRFNGSRQALGVPAEDSPVSGQTSWTVAMVFRTDDTVKMTSGRQFYQGRALFGAELPLTTRADWGLTFWNERGRLLAGYGGQNAGNADRNVIGRPVELNDDEPHSVIVVYDTDEGYINVVVDGVPCVTSTMKCSPATPRDAVRVGIGAMNADAFFKGDIAAFRLYGRPLAHDEIEALAEGWRVRYGIIEQPKEAHAVGASGQYGLGAKTIAVDAGATLVLPMAQTAPFTLAEGQTLTCAGQVKGTLAVGAGGTFDCASATPTGLDELWLRDGATLSVARVGAPIALTSFKAVGAVTVDVDWTGPLPVRVPIFSYTDAAAVSNATVTVVGAGRTTSLVVDEARRQVLLYTQKGTLLIFR